MDAHNTKLWRVAGRYLEDFGLRADQAHIVMSHSLAWSDQEDAVDLPGELPSTLLTLTAETTATATWEGRINEFAVYRLRSGNRLVILLEEREDERWGEAWLAEDTREANLIVLTELERWIRIGAKVSASWAACPGDEADATPAYVLVVRHDTGEACFVPIDQLEVLWFRSADDAAA